MRLASQAAQVAKGKKLFLSEETGHYGNPLHTMSILSGEVGHPRPYTTEPQSFLICDNRTIAKIVKNINLKSDHLEQIKMNTGLARLIRSHSSARICFKLSGNSN